MIGESLKSGFRFAVLHDMTKKEIEIFLPLLDKPMTNEEIATKLGKPLHNVYHVIARLKMKKLITLKDKDDKKANIYETVIQEIAEKQTPM